MEEKKKRSALEKTDRTKSQGGGKKKTCDRKEKEGKQMSESNWGRQIATNGGGAFAFVRGGKQ